MRGGARGNDNVLDTINAAATAIASSDDRLLHQASPIHRRRKWWNRWICFRSPRQRKRIGKASLAPEPVQQISTDSNSSGYRSVITALPFIAPPSSPASFFQSEPPSATQSPVGILSFSPVPSCNTRPSIFAIGPYAHETQLVSPPVFSTYTTEPSSAPITPPLDESFYLTTTTPSSPEVPFAQLFNSNLQTGNNYGAHRFTMSNYEFQFYQLPPGSPLGQLISPSSVVSGSGPTSPFPDGETAMFSQFQVSDPPKLLTPCPKTIKIPKEQKVVRPHKPVSFDLDADHVIRCVDQKLRTTFPEASTSVNDSDSEALNESSPGSNKEFNFGTDEKHLTIDEHSSPTKNNNNWSFFPVMQSGTLS